jgi:hypothetical protein
MVDPTLRFLHRVAIVAYARTTELLLLVTLVPPIDLPSERSLERVIQ